MRLSKASALLLLAVTLVPLAYFFLFMATVLGEILSDANDTSLADFFPTLMVMHVACMLWVWGLLAFYVVYLFRSDAVKADQKALWAVVLFLGSLIAMPVFWYLHIWSRAGPSVPAA